MWVFERSKSSLPTNNTGGLVSSCLGGGARNRLSSGGTILKCHSVMTKRVCETVLSTKPLQLQNDTPRFKIFFGKSFHLKLFNEPDYPKICCFVLGGSKMSRSRLFRVEYKNVYNFSEALNQSFKKMFGYIWVLGSWKWKLLCQLKGQTDGKWDTWLT